jgi:SPP1 gp7 family putative phage head morphogenesis protein
MAGDRAAVLLSQVADLLRLINTRNAEDIQEAFENLLRGADAQGTTLADDLSRAIANQQLQMTANVPLAAIVNQATEGMKRLRNHTEAFADRASTIVTQGLVQGWGTDKVASLLQKEMGLVRHKAETIARTESISALDSSTRATYQQNGIGYVQRIGTLDNRICPFCVARIGNVYPVDKAPATLHPRDRCYNSPFKFEWIELGLVDTAWLQKFKQGAIAELAKQGLEPDDGVAPFEKANGLSAPEPVWTLGQKLDHLNLDEGKIFAEWREDAGIPCGKGWIAAGRKCTKGVSPQHAAANPSHPQHAAYQSAVVAHGGGSQPAAKATKKTATKQAATPAPVAQAAPSQPATPAKKASTKKPATTSKTTKKAIAQKTSATAATHPDFEPLHAMANGTKPDTIAISQSQLQAAKNFMGTGYKGTPKQKQIQKEGKTTADESQALSHWLGSSYTTMSKRIWNPGAVEDKDKGILTANILATQALHKLPAVTAAQVEKGAKSKGHFDFDADKPLSRWMKIPEANVSRSSKNIRMLRAKKFRKTTSLAPRTCQPIKWAAFPWVPM